MKEKEELKKENKELESEIKLFLNRVDEIIRTSKNIPSSKYVSFDPYLFFIWRLDKSKLKIKEFKQLMEKSDKELEKEITKFLNYISEILTLVKSTQHSINFDMELFLLYSLKNKGELKDLIDNFFKDISELINTSKQIPGQTINFDPKLFIIWRMNKNDND